MGEEGEGSRAGQVGEEREGLEQGRQVGGNQSGVQGRPCVLAQKDLPSLWGDFWKYLA